MSKPNRLPPVPELTPRERQLLMAAVVEGQAAADRLRQAQEEFSRVSNKPSHQLETILTLKGYNPRAWGVEFHVDTQELFVVPADPPRPVPDLRSGAPPAGEDPTLPELRRQGAPTPAG